MSEISISHASESDIPAMVAMSYEKRRDYERAQPQFWKYAEKAEEIQTNWFIELMGKDDYILLIAHMNNEMYGFIIGRIMQAPEVYNPGGLTLMIDDFCVKAPALWYDVGTILIDEMKALAKPKGAAQILVVCGAHDKPKAEFLNELGLNVASEWYVSSI
jgi:hypothetical protein